MKKLRKKFSDKIWEKGRSLSKGDLVVIIIKDDLNNYKVNLIRRELLDESHLTIPWYDLPDYAKKLGKYTGRRVFISKEIKTVLKISEIIFRDCEK